MKLIKIPARDFDLAMTLDSGQVFHWEKVGKGFVGTIGDLPVYVEQSGNVLKVRCGVTPQGRRGDRSLELSRDYFALDHPLGRNLRVVPGRSGDERGARILSRLADHSATEMGMSGHLHLFVDETGGAYSPDFARASEPFW